MNGIEITAGWDWVSVTLSPPWRCWAPAGSPCRGRFAGPNRRGRTRRPRYSRQRAARPCSPRGVSKAYRTPSGEVVEVLQKSTSRFPPAA